MDRNRGFRVRLRPRGGQRRLSGSRGVGIGLDDEPRVANAGKRTKIRGQQVHRTLALLPLEDAVEDHFLRRDLQRVDPAIAAVRLHDMRQLEDWRAQAALKHRHVEIARQPDFHHVAERGAPLQRHRVGFPHGHADRVPQRKGEAAPLRRNPVEDMKIAGSSPVDKRLHELVADLRPVARQVDGRDADSGGVQRVHVAARRLTVAGRVEQVPVIHHAQVVHDGAPTGTVFVTRARTSSAVNVLRQSR